MAEGRGLVREELVEHAVKVVFGGEGEVFFE